MVPLGSSVTNGEFWNPVSGWRVVMTDPVVPSRTTTPLIVGASTSW